MREKRIGVGSYTDKNPLFYKVPEYYTTLLDPNIMTRNKLVSVIAYADNPCDVK